ncbi:MAG: cystathionine beta-synthase [Cytophagales bacterium]|nr:cystathionine beta-synthase [Cytophagales bacterium]
MVTKISETVVQKFIENVLKNLPTDWLRLTTHRLDIYHEELAKTEFLEHFEALYQNNDTSQESLASLPTAFDYIRLGHPLSCVLEWTIAKSHDLKADQVISFSSQVMPLMAILRKNLFDHKPTRVYVKGQLPHAFDLALVKEIYGYKLDVQQVSSIHEVAAFDGSSVYISNDNLTNVELTPNVDFFLHIDDQVGSVVLINGEANENHIGEIQHVRRRESIAMTPADCHTTLQEFVGQTPDQETINVQTSKASVVNTIQSITGTSTHALVASSGLSTQYAIMMGLVHHAKENYPGKPIRIITPPNAYGGTNDQARRVAACVPNTEVVDLHVDGGNDMSRSVNSILDEVAREDAVPFIIAEIPTNPRVEVPDLENLRAALSKQRSNAVGQVATAPVFILDQTFCPNVHFLRDQDILAEVSTLAYISGSKFPSGGLCTAGYVAANSKAERLLATIDTHLQLCDNEATHLQYEILAKQMPSMLERIEGAYQNTREFVNFIQETLPEAKINFVSEELAQEGFTPSVFSLDLPTKGDSDEVREAYKRDLNLQLINLMIGNIPQESKYCVSYGQLKGCYWTIPATSTQGTTKEGDKDYIVRVALSANMDLGRHKEVFTEFVKSI